MADSKCCFGFSNIRKAAYVIAIFDLTIFTLLIIHNVSMMNFIPYQVRVHLDGEKNTSIFELKNDLNSFVQLFVLIMFVYVNLNLKKATYIHDIGIISHWLLTNTIFFVLFILFICFIGIKYSLNFLAVGLFMCIFMAYQIYVVKCFYDDELKYTANQSAVTQTPFVTATIQNAYPVETGPYIVQQVPHQPGIQVPYPQQVYEYQQQQQPAQVVHQLVEPHAAVPQEYSNPPPYSPNYTIQESGSTYLKQ